MFINFLNEIWCRGSGHKRMSARHMAARNKLSDKIDGMELNGDDKTQSLLLLYLFALEN